MLKGVLDGMVLAIISQCETYGYEIGKKLYAMDFEDLAQATVYALLLRLEKNNLVFVTKKPSDKGPPRKFYTLNRRGIEELASFWDRWDFLVERIQMLRNNGGEDDDIQSEN